MARSPSRFRVSAIRQRSLLQERNAAPVTPSAAVPCIRAAGCCPASVYVFPNSLAARASTGAPSRQRASPFPRLRSVTGRLVRPSWSPCELANETVKEAGNEEQQHRNPAGRPYTRITSAIVAELEKGTGACGPRDSGIPRQDSGRDWTGKHPHDIVPRNSG